MGLFDLLKVPFIRSPKLIEVELGGSIEELRSRYPAIGANAKPSEWEGCIDYRLKLPDYLLHAAVKDGEIVAIIHDTERHRVGAAYRLKKLFHLQKVYSGGSDFRHVLDNGFGFTYKKEDGNRVALYSYECDIFSVYYASLKKVRDRE